jgi:hypothetical protein
MTRKMARMTNNKEKGNETDVGFTQNCRGRIKCLQYYISLDPALSTGVQ